MTVNVGSADPRVKQEHAEVARTERRAREFAQRIRQNGPTVNLPRGARGGGLGGTRGGVKQERWEDDDRREGRTLTRVSRDA